MDGWVGMGWVNGDFPFMLCTRDTEVRCWDQTVVEA